MSSTQNLPYSIQYKGNFTIIRFSSAGINDIVFRNGNLSISRANITEFVLRDESTLLKLTYTNDINNIDVSMNDYIDRFITKNREQEVLVNTGADISGNQIDSLTSVNKFGRNPDIDIGPEDIWGGGDNYTGLNATTSQTVQVFSSDVDDAAGDTGARTIRFFGLQTSSSTEYTSEDITMNGTSIVTSVNSWYRINTAYVLTAGSTGSNEGTITIRQSSTTANVFAVILPNLNQTTIAAYTIPSGKTGYLDTFTTNIVRSNGSLGAGLITIRLRNTPTANSVFRTINSFDIQTGSAINQTFKYPIIIPEGNDIKFRCESVSDGNSSISVNFSLILVDN
jgi:hypothetical protein